MTTNLADNSIIRDLCQVLSHDPTDDVAIARLTDCVCAEDGLLQRGDFIDRDALPAQAWSGLGLQFADRDHLDAAVLAFTAATDLQPGWADAWYNLGESHRRLGALDAALSALAQAAQADPHHPGAWFSLGNVRAAVGDLNGATEAYDRALEISDRHAAAHNNRAVVLRRLGHLTDAALGFRRAIGIDPQYATAFDNLGNTLADLGESDAAVTAYETAIRLIPTYHDAHYNLGNVHRDAGRADRAIECYGRALELKPDHEDARTHLGILLQELGRLKEAEAAFQPLLGFIGDHARTHANIANVLRDQGRYDEALEKFEIALAKGDDPHLLGNRALTLQHAGRVDEALADYRAALSLTPDDVILHNNLSHALLIYGHFEEGWSSFERRLKDPELAGLGVGIDAPRWMGEPLDGKSILLCYEQGLGDAIQFIRFTTDLCARGADVTVACPPRLHRLFKGAKDIVQLVSSDPPYPKCDFWSPLLSLPGLLGTALEDYTAAVPYLSPEPALVDRWTSSLETDRSRRVGIAWQGNPDYQGDHARSIPLRYLWPTIDRPEIAYFSLQKGTGADQLAPLNADESIKDVAPLLDLDDAFVDTAAVLSELDLLITSDTSLPHLAGALGCPVWLLLPYAPDWRWLLDRRDSPWYPSMRLFRQPAPWDWPGTVHQIGNTLDAWLANGGDPLIAFDAYHRKAER